ncbi:hypothetical protein [Nonomuraea insulae]|uniref:Uncharacterized protein n=1 Tax=Nonomuraea insulae TaxID=1616787 RepID=A0ABW1D2P0_9ACTN
MPGPADLLWGAVGEISRFAALHTWDAVTINFRVTMNSGGRVPILEVALPDEPVWAGRR